MRPKENARITFYGGTGNVTGANFLLETPASTLIVDCGLIQGLIDHRKDPNYEDFPYDLALLDAAVITHAHMDHIGRIPKLVRDGYKGRFYSTPATKDLAYFMLADAYKIMVQESERYGHAPMYLEQHVTEALSRWDVHEYYEQFSPTKDVSVIFRDAGHILGSAIAEMSVCGKKVVFTGDLGNTPTPLLRDTDVVTGADYLITESVYGDRNHEQKAERLTRLKEAITCVLNNKGTLLVPVFSLEKTQVLLYELNKLIEAGEVPSVPVFLDSPLAIDVTGVYRQYSKHFKEVVQKQMAEGDDIFHFPKLVFTRAREDASIIDSTPSPKIIMAGSGMSGGGRVLNHEIRLLPHKENAILMIGYQTLGTLGRQIKDGIKRVKIDGQWVEVHADIINISGYSSHKDSNGLVEFASHSAETLKKAFCVMGEPKSAQFLAQRFRDELGVQGIAPVYGQTFDLE